MHDGLKYEHLLGAVQLCKALCCGQVRHFLLFFLRRRRAGVKRILHKIFISRNIRKMVKNKELDISRASSMFYEK